MKKISLSIVLVFFISFICCKEEEKYTFIYDGKGDNKAKVKITEEFVIYIPSIGNIQYASTYTSLGEYLGK